MGPLPPAIRGLIEAQPDEMSEELAACLKDSTSEVRVAAAEAVFESFERSREPALYRIVTGEEEATFDSWEFRNLAESVSADTLRQMLVEAARSAGRLGARVEGIETDDGDEPDEQADAPGEQPEQTNEVHSFAIAARSAFPPANNNP